MADLNNFCGTAIIAERFEKTTLEGKEVVKGKLSIHNYKNFYSSPYIVVEGKKAEKLLSLEVNQSVKIKNAVLRSKNEELVEKIPVRTLNSMGQLVVSETTFKKSYTDVYLYIDDKDGSDIIPTDNVGGQDDLNTFNFTGRICTEPQDKIVGQNKNSLSFVAAVNFAKKNVEPSFLYVVIEGKEANRLRGRLSASSKFSGNAILRTKTKQFLFDYEETAIDEENSTDGLIRYKQVTRQKEVDIEQLEVLFLDYSCQINFIDKIKNPDLAEQFGENV